MGFRILSQEGVSSALARIEAQWHPSPEEQERYDAWAWVVASVCETYASENPGACADLLRDEQASLSRVLHEREHYRQDGSGELESKRAFLAWLERSLVPANAAAA